MREVVAFGDIDYTNAVFGATDDARELSVAIDAAFDRIIATSHQLATRADVLLDRAVIAEGIQVTGGQVTSDRDQSIQSSCIVTISDPLRVPVAADDILTPYGYELRLWRGVAVAGGQIMAPQGVFPIQRSSVDGVTLLSSITAQDRSKTVSDAIFEDTYQIAAGTNYATAIEALIEDGAPGFTFLFPSTTFTTPILTFGPDENRWAEVQRMARSIGNEIFFDGLGRCVMRPEPTFTSEPVGEIAEGSNMLGVVVDLDRGPAFNKVIATSSNSSLTAPVTGSATDNDPSSPTQYGPRFGRKARRFSSPFLTTVAQCNSAAAAILASNLGVARSINATVVTDPRREVSDVITVKREALGLNNELHIVDRMTLGLGSTESMTASVRAQQVPS